MKIHRLAESYLRRLFLFCLGFCLAHSSYSQFNHPGVVIGRADLDRMKAKINTAPWSTGYANLASKAEASLTYTMRGPFATVGREPNVNRGQFEGDCNAVLYQAIQYYMTGNVAYANKAMQILNAWATTHTSWSGGTPFISASEFGINMIIGAEILRYTYPGWTAATTTNCENYFRNVFWPLFGVGSGQVLRGANQGAFQLQGAMAVAVFCNDASRFAQTLDSWHYDAAALANGSLANGQLGDTGRDQPHALIQIRGLAYVAETAWKQGVDLYGELGNRLLAISEYFSRYNLGNAVPYTPFGCTYDYYLTISPSDGVIAWGNLPMELIHAAYSVRKGAAAPYTRQYLDAVTPDLNTFLYKNDAFNGVNPPAPPTPLVPAAPPAAATLTSADIGTTGLAGSSTYSGGTWTVRGAGSDFWGSPDSGHFAYKTLTGNGTIVARITGMGNTDANAKAGIMIRDSLSPTALANRVLLVLSPNGNVQCIRTNASGTTVSEIQPSNNVPHWLKLVRNGNYVYAYHCINGVDWSCAQVVPITAGSTLYVGLAVTSKNTSVLNTSTFTDVAISTSGGAFENGIYRIAARSSGKVMDVLARSTVNGTAVQEYTYGGGLNQLWDITDAGSGRYRIIGVASGKALDVTGISTGEDIPLQIYTAGGGNNQRFTFTPTTDGYQRITPVHSGKAVKVGVPAAGSHVPVQQATYTGTTAQQWTLQAP